MTDPAARSPVTPRPSRAPGRALRPSVEGLEGRALLAGAGALDPSFGRGGIATAPLSVTAGAGLTSVASVAVQADGKVVEAGVVGQSPALSFGVVRLNADGTRDTSFGRSGEADVSYEALGGNLAYVDVPPLVLPGVPPSNHVAIQPDGKVVIVGTVQRPTDPSSPAGLRGLAARFNPDGTPDASFGSGGVAIFDASGSTFDTLALQPDGKLVLGGSGLALAGDPDRALVAARLDASGSLDPTFGRGGIAALAPPGQTGPKSDAVASVAIAPDGRIALAGSHVFPEPSGNFGTEGELALLAPDGSPDPAFLGGQIALLGDLGPATEALFQPDGQLVLITRLGDGADSGATATRFRPDGTRDASGPVAPGLGRAFDPGGAALQPDGSIVVAGTGVSGATAAPFVVARLRPDLTPDAGFGASGVASFGVPGAATLSGRLAGVAIAPDGRIVVAGPVVQDGTPPLASNLTARLVAASPAPSADLSVSEDGSASASDDGALSIALTVTNAGPDFATDVVLADALPAGSIVGASVTVLGVFSPIVPAIGPDGVARFAIPDVGPSRPVTLVIRLRGTGEFTDRVVVTSATADPDPTNNEIRQAFTFPPPTPAPPPTPVDLAVTQTSFAAAVPGRVGLFPVVVTNRGTSPATGVVLVDRLPSPAVILDVATTRGRVAPLGPSVVLARVDIGTIAPGDSVTVIVVFVPTTTGTLFNLAAVSGDQPDPDPSNNLSGLANDVPGPTDLAVTQVPFPGSGLPGEIQLSAVVVTNLGPQAATGVVLIDRLPLGARLIQVIPAQDSVSAVPGGVALIHLGTIGPGASATVTFAFVPGAAGAYANLAAAGGEQPDPDPSNNLSMATLAALDGPTVAGVALSRDGKSLLVTFSEPIESGAADPANFPIVDLGPSAVILPRRVALKKVAPVAGTSTIRITPAGLTPGQNLRLRLVGSTPGGLADLAGRRLDGAGDGRPGSDFTATFRVGDLPRASS